MINLSANIENGFPEGIQYIVTPNGKKAAQSIVDGFRSGIHSFSIIGTYGTGKSSFLLAFEEDLKANNRNKRLINPSNLYDGKGFEVMNIVGDYTELAVLLGRKLSVEGRSQSILDELKKYYNQLKAQNKFLLIVIDEFGKVLEHAAKNNPEQEVYFLQKLAEFVNAASRDILLLTTLHQNFGAYAKDLTESQKNEWTKVKGRFKEIAFVEPIEQIIYLASKELPHTGRIKSQDFDPSLHQLATETKFVSDTFSEATALQLYPLDTFSSYVITAAIERYGQNERSLFSFLASRGENSLAAFRPKKNLTYNLSMVYDYITYNFYSYLKEANADSMSWSSMMVSIERVEAMDWDSALQMANAVKIVKSIGLMNLFGTAGFLLDAHQMAKYASLAMGVSDAQLILDKLERFKIIRYAIYKHRLLLFEGTDVDIELELRNAAAIVARPVAFIDDLRCFINDRISPVKAHYYQKGTPRYFEYEIREEPVDIIPTGDIDGYIELIFSPKHDALEVVKDFSASHIEHANIFVCFNNTDEVVEHMYNIKKYDYIITKVLIDKEADRVAFGEIQKLKEYEEDLLNKTIVEGLYGFNNQSSWVFEGAVQHVASQRSFNRLLSMVCDKVYCKAPVMHNELFNRHKLSSTISAARKNYLSALVGHYDEEDMGFEKSKFPPEKTIYYSLLKNTGLHHNGSFTQAPTNGEFASLWEECESFLSSSSSKPRRISELIKTLSTQPYKLKQGFLDFWIPTYLFIKRQDYALYDVGRGTYIPSVDISFFDLLQKHPNDYAVKAFEIDGIKIEFFNQYRRFVNLGDEFSITSDSFIETIKPFLSFYKRLNDYTKHTKKFAHSSTLKFRDVLATAKDPEKAFFEDLPTALGFAKGSLKQASNIGEYGNLIQRAIRELRSCYPQLLDRIEERIVDELGLESGDYSEYIVEIRTRLTEVRQHLLTAKQREFYNHVMTEYENRTMWLQSICYPVLEHRLESMRDEEEAKLLDDLVFLFSECEKYADISKRSRADCSDAFSFDMVTSRGTSVKTQTYVLPEKDKAKAEELEKQIDHLLSRNSNVDICALLSLLDKKMKK